VGWFKRKGWSSCRGGGFLWSNENIPGGDTDQTIEKKKVIHYAKGNLKKK